MAKLERFRQICWSLVPICLIFLLVTLSVTGWRVATIAGRIDDFLTVEKMDELHAATIHSGDAAQIMANSYSEVGYTTQDVLQNHLAPAIDKFSAQVDQTAKDIRQTNSVVQAEIPTTMASARGVLDSTTGNLDTLNHTQAVVGEDIHTTLGTSNSILASVDKRMGGVELDQFLADVAATGHAIRLVIDDPQLIELIKKNEVNVTEITGGLATTTVQLGNSSTLITNKLNAVFNPPPVKGFWANFGRVMKVAAQWVITGAGAAYYVVRIGQ